MLKIGLLLLFFVSSTLQASGQSGFLDQYIPKEESDQKAGVISEFIDSEFSHLDAEGNSLIIQNSLPKGGLSYTDTNGDTKRYLVFWTRITNNRNAPVRLELQFPTEPLPLLSSPEVYVTIVIPTDSLDMTKLHLKNYGFDTSSILDAIDNTHNFSQKMIAPTETKGFYVVVLSKKGVAGSVRAGLNLSGNDLIYRINDTKLHCGRLNPAP